MTDWDLLERFTQSRCDRAFAELVARHAGFVYATCRRRLRDAHLAEDATQAVFVVLARRPPVRREGSVLAGWLYQTAIYACNNEMRIERIRVRHEREAIAQRDRAIAESNAPAISAEVESQLDDALASLGTGDRDVLLLRYFEDLDLRQIGAALGLSESAASKRATRALDRLRTTFQRLGQQALSASVVTEFLRPPAPPGLIERVTSAALSPSAGVAVESITNGVIHIMLNLKAKLIASAVAATLVVAGGATLSVSMLFAQAAPPATQPAPANHGTPMDALRTFIEMYKRYDATSIRTMMVATDERGRRMMNAMCEYVQAAHEIRKALTDKFGPEVIEEVPELAQLSELDSLKQIDDQMLGQFEEQIENDVARLRPLDPQFDEFVLVRQNGAWKISADHMTSTWTAEQTDVRVGKTRGVTIEVKLLTKQIESGDFQSVDEFRQALEPLVSRGR